MYNLITNLIFSSSSSVILREMIRGAIARAMSGLETPETTGGEDAPNLSIPTLAWPPEAPVDGAQPSCSTSQPPPPLPIPSPADPILQVKLEEKERKMNAHQILTFLCTSKVLQAKLLPLLTER